MICNSPFRLLDTEVNAMIMYITDKNREIQVELFEGWFASVAFMPQLPPASILHVPKTNPTKHLPFFDYPWHHSRPVGGKNNGKEVFWDFDSILLQDLSEILPLFWHQHGCPIMWVQSKNCVLVKGFSRDKLIISTVVPWHLKFFLTPSCKSIALGICSHRGNIQEDRRYSTFHNENNTSSVLWWNKCDTCIIQGLSFINT